LTHVPASTGRTFVSKKDSGSSPASARGRHAINSATPIAVSRKPLSIFAAAEIDRECDCSTKVDQVYHGTNGRGTPLTR
jgi:hypothetical protein